MDSRPIVAIYADGGVIGKNPSPIGGTWAWCAVSKGEVRLMEASGVVPAPEGKLITNNHTEFIALTLAMEAMAEGWSGLVCSDSQISLGRLFYGWKLKNLPANVHKRGIQARMRLGILTPVLLQGHPTKRDLERGIGAKRGYPVSTHNVWCDKRCQEEAERYMRGMAKMIPTEVLQVGA